mmetsp:Transcript_5268/g.9145  ORF Transcript_5268/g.9145 Transcript_5268/m.9145 type:complete len:82 (+) Transcript_5268:333-578(+)
MSTRTAEENAPSSSSSEPTTALPGQTPTNSNKKETSAQPERGVQWVDMYGYELAQVREFDPSDEDEADDDVQNKKGCCTVC